MIAARAPSGCGRPLRGRKRSFSANTSRRSRVWYVDGRMTDSAETRWCTRMDSERRSEEETSLPAGGGFAVLLARIEVDLRRVVAGVGFGPADADDILQDVRIKALDSPGSYRGEEEARRWLLRVATNQCIVEFRQRRRFQRMAAQSRLPAQQEEMEKYAGWDQPIPVIGPIRIHPVRIEGRP